MTRNWNTDTFVTSSLLPRTCDLRGIESVKDWMEYKYNLAKASVEATEASQSKRKTRQNAPKHVFGKAAESSSDTSDSSSDEEEVPVSIQTAHETTKAKETKRMSTRSKKVPNKDKGSSEETVREAQQQPCSSQQASKSSKRKIVASQKKPTSKVISEDDDCEQDFFATPDSKRSYVPEVRSPRPSLQCATIPKPRNLVREKSPVSDEDEAPVTKPKKPVRTQTPSSAADTVTSSARNQNPLEVAVQLLLDNTRQLRHDFEEMQRTQRAQAKSISIIKVAMGRLVYESNSCTAAATTSRQGGPIPLESTASSISLRGQSAEGMTQTTLENVTRVKSNILGSLRWIQSNYGPEKAKEIVQGLQKLKISSSKWSGIFEGRFSGDKLMAVRLLRARYSEEQLANFCMSRPNQSKALEGSSNAADTTLNKKTLLPDKDLMLGKIVYFIYFYQY